VNSDEGQDSHDNDHQADKIDDAVHEALRWMGKGRPAMELDNERATGSAVPSVYGRLTVPASKLVTHAQ
jgi:hypothetical protein